MESRARNDRLFVGKRVRKIQIWRQILNVILWFSDDVITAWRWKQRSFVIYVLSSTVCLEQIYYVFK